ncbi:Nif3-like dinuclear metal center hexameric protein [Herbaspirillum sp. RTI4]|uniref:Nif3-like dinuclear metal center hexameric protein n=1 Tax=Herbaspirillum sp. RTI4 TaxID=3048640 RepID=UPI002AB42DE6|nr:Nif3-like dinuclear metal center hexameric protein [Herbaspirillum sp. RTI4]MDY7577762.1 Nif3-like dinuclear metal center hexameric protein [Herbaspirillum sp. RTI4]MEA9980810.1 Nif3-like dinuclear metal center hexameric protein [Herbaspirillum sp. RTI4]
MPYPSIYTDDLVKYLAILLNVTQYRDYCPNGLQVEGRSEVGVIVSGVTASRALIEAALDLRADAILVHHGYFWRGEEPSITGIKQQRLKLLLQHDLNLLAYHLPLDGHPQLGNNAQLAARLSLQEQGRFGENDLGWLGLATEPGVTTVGQLTELISVRLGRAPLLIGDPEQPLGSVAWCTGGAQGMLGAAIGAGAGVYISGEISEPTVHLARESGTAYIAAGHHATERYGVQALGEHLAQHFGIQHHFVDIDNPV